MHQAEVKATIFKTTLGWVGLALSDKGVRAVVLPRSTRHAVERELKNLIEGAVCEPTAAVHLTAAKAAVLAYLTGRSRQFDLPLDLDGHSAFHQRVWEALRRIPYGRVRSYGWVARKVGKPQAARAVGAACGANPVPLLVPCHRVVAGDGSLGGFAGGLRLKKRLLTLEGVI